MAEGPGGPQRCPYCQRNFRRLRAHLPHCKAAPGLRGEAAAGTGTGNGTEAEVARSLDLRPEEAAAAAAKLRRGPKVAIEKHRAVVLRERPGPGPGPGARPSPGPQGAAPGAAGPEAAGRGAPGPGGCSTGEARGAGRRPSPGELLPQRGAARTGPGEGQRHGEGAAGHGAPRSASHSESLRLSAEQPGGRGEGTAKNELTGAPEPGGSERQMAGVTEPLLNARRDAPFLPRASQRQPICLSRGSGRSARAGAVGLEWFPELRPNYQALSAFAERPFQGEPGVATKTPEGNFSEGQRGPLAERRLMDVRLGELPTWLATRDFSPRGLLGGVQKAWNSYCNKYINVKKGGAAGVSMLLAGYCILSYGWSYQHIKCNRWRKYH
uniref:ATP synthase subunit f, mitochondrial n=1 Tax=Anser brachyrhynchus TaxID=132585 RepID=A0A8B9C030_9AVES